MSYDRLRAIRESGLTATQKHVACMLSLRADATGETWAAVTTIAADCSLSPRAVGIAIEALVQAGAVTRRSRIGQTAVYTFGTIAPRVPATPEPASDPTPEPASPPNLVRPPPEPASGVPPNLVRTTPEPRSDYQPTDLPTGSAHGSAHQTGVGGVGSLQMVEAVALATALQQADHPERGTRLDLADRRAVEAAARNGATPDDLARVWSWTHLSGDSGAAFLRGKGLERWRSILNDNAGDRLAQSRRWEDRGRVDVVEPGQPQRQRQQPIDHIAEMHEALRIMRGQNNAE